MTKALRFRQASVPKQQGELARVKVVQGPDYGTLFVLMGDRASIGRGDENDIVIADLKSSRSHAEFVFNGLTWQIKDKGSANGIFFSGKAVREAALKTGATFMLGETTLEFVAAEAGTQMLVAPPRSMGQVQSDQAALAARKASIRAMGKGGKEPGSSQGGIFQSKTFLTVMGLAVATLILFGGEDTGKKSNKKPEPKRDLSSFLPPMEENAITSKAAEVFFRGGFREFREKNFLRAKIQFETVLQMVPGHRLATIYLENCNKSIEDEVRFHMEKGKKSSKTGKLKESKAHYEAVLRLLYRDQASPSFIEAKDQLIQFAKSTNGEQPEGGNP